MALENRPVGRTDDLVVQELNGEVLIYDLKENKAFCLNETSALVWRACDGNHTVDEIGKQLGSEDLAWLALSDLKKQKLVDHNIGTPAKFEGMSRREVVKTLGMSTMLAIPTIAALVAPAAATAGPSTCGMFCQSDSECMEPGPEVCGFCNGNFTNPGVCVSTDV